MTQANVHLIEDESLGGLLREYVETDRKADVGDYVTYVHKGKRDNIAVKVEDIDGCGHVHFDESSYTDKEGGIVSGFGPNGYKTLDPTDIVRVDNQRYKLVDRRAEVGEKVVVIEKENVWFSCGEIFEVYDNDYPCPAVGNEDHDNVLDGDYRVLEPVESEQAEIVTVDESQASPDVIDMLTNLSRRIVRLEDENKRILEELDVLHSNQKRMAEELANLSAATNSEQESAEVIVELAKLLVEKVREGGR